MWKEWLVHEVKLINRWSDGTQAWDNLPPTLHQKLSNRSKALPGVSNLAISMDNNWLILFKDGSFANSGFPITPKLQDSLFEDSAPALFTFAPAGGWVLVRGDGTIAFDKLPSTLHAWIENRTAESEMISKISISSYGGWFVLTKDKFKLLIRTYAWEGLPTALCNLLDAQEEKTELFVSLSLFEGLQYLVSCDSKLEWVHPSATLTPTLQYARSETTQLPSNVTWEANVKSM